MADSFQEKTEDPTPRALERARESGNVPRSSDLSTAVQLLAGALFFLAAGASLFGRLSHVVAAELRDVAMEELTLDGAVVLLRKMAPAIVSVTAPLFALLVTAALGLSLLQNRGVRFTPQVLRLRLDRLSPGRGLRKIFSLRGLVRVGMALARLCVILGVVLLVLWWEWDRIATLSLPGVEGFVRETGDITASLFLTVAAVLLLLGAADYLYQRWQWLRDLRMTKQEVKDEHKSQEGDPQVKRRIRGRQLEFLRAGLSQAVREATVVITNPTHFAVALRYEDGKKGAPVVVAKGVDWIAQEIQRLARSHDVPVVEQPLLARTLYRDVPLGRPIPERLYRAVASVLAFVYRLQEERRRRSAR